jgi:hypothetical protein
MAMQVGPDNPDKPGQVSDKTRTDTDTPLRGVRCPDCLFAAAKKKRGGARAAGSLLASLQFCSRQYVAEDGIEHQILYLLVTCFVSCYQAFLELCRVHVALHEVSTRLENAR